MKIAVHYGATDQTADPGSVAREVEARGFDGIFFPEHTHMPVRQKGIPYPNNDERMVHYRRLYSPFVSMSWAATATKNLKVGTCVSLAVEHDPIVLAKTLASIDALSGGRVVYGFGFGWLDEEMVDHGVDPNRRRATTREKMLAAQAIWTQDEPSFSGDFVRFPPCWSWPKPHRGRRLPVLLGAGGTDQVFDHVIEYCDGWMPPLHEGIIANIQRLRARAADKGRDPATIEVDVISRDRSAKLFEQYREAGVQRVIIHLPFAQLDKIRRTLDDYAAQFVGKYD